jgi:hypothetical protein
MYRDLKGKLQSAADRGNKRDEDDNVEGDWQNFDDVLWSVNHAKLLYLISKYAVTAQTVEEEETWIRMVPLLVMVYEGIVAGVLDFDYAPQSTLISQDGCSKRSFMNVTQEGKSAIDDLREQKMLNGLKLSSEDFQPVTAFQCSVKGLEFISNIPLKLKKDVDGFIYAPKPFQDMLLLVQLRRMYDEEEGREVQRFFLTAEGGYEKMSTVTETEDVSYVASPYLPLHVRKSEKPMSSNAVSVCKSPCVLHACACCVSVCVCVRLPASMSLYTNTHIQNITHLLNINKILRNRTVICLYFVAYTHTHTHTCSTEQRSVESTAPVICTCIRAY